MEIDVGFKDGAWCNAFPQGCWSWGPFTAPMPPTAGAELDKTFHNPQPSHSSPPFTFSSEYQGHSSTVHAASKHILRPPKVLHIPPSSSPGYLRALPQQHLPLGNPSSAITTSPGERRSPAWGCRPPWRLSALAGAEPTPRQPPGVPPAPTAVRKLEGDADMCQQ